jgi:hypothetical protein
VVQHNISRATLDSDAPSTAEAISSGRVTEILQPVTEAVRTNTNIAFITIMAPDGTRFTHTDPTQIGGHYLGTIEPALRSAISARGSAGPVGSHGVHATLHPIVLVVGKVARREHPAGLLGVQRFGILEPRTGGVAFVVGVAVPAAAGRRPTPARRGRQYSGCRHCRDD